MKKPAVAIETGKAGLEARAMIGEKGRKILRESDGHRLLAAYGIVSPKDAIASSAEEAGEAARHLGYPVALKVDSAQIAHKTESGAMALGIQDDASLRKAYQGIRERVRNAYPQVEFQALLQKMAPEGVEMIIGVIMDEQFGPAVVLGMGGVLVEILRDTAVRRAPVDPEEARAMIQELAGYRLLAGYRGQPAADLAELADTVSRVSRLALDLQDRLVALDINPLRVLPDGHGVMALDVLVELK